MIRRRTTWIPAALGTVLALGGCSDGDALPRVAVTGKVTVEGEPLSKGTVTFRPVGEGAEATGVVENGAFAIAAADGPTPGKYQVSATETIERAESEKLNNFTLQPKAKPSKETIGGPLDAEVKPGAENSFPFDFPKVGASKTHKSKAQ